MSDHALKEPRTGVLACGRPPATMHSPWSTARLTVCLGSCGPITLSRGAGTAGLSTVAASWRLAEYSSSALAYPRVILFPVNHEQRALWDRDNCRAPKQPVTVGFGRDSQRERW